MINEEPNAPEEAPAADKDTAPSEKPEQGLDASEWILVVLSFIAVTLTFPLSIWLCIEVVYEYEQAVILRLGHMKKGGAKGPGVYFLLPCTDIILRVDMRTRSVNLPLQEIFTKDPLNVDVDGVIYFRVKNPVLAVTGAIDVDTAIQLLAQTTLKMVVGTKNLSEVISNREKIAQSVQSTLDNVISHWGVKVERVEINDVKARVKVYLALALSPEGGREPVDHYCTSMSLFKGNRDPYLLRGDKDLWGTILYS
ncbi:stomatin-like isoform X2 [Rhineura floridana]|uniref:stomatin-like isoform X2 n=1 Tax=Rhineura floridana TaxID=261503 RepID=UPI002AC82905|nr:stomatin-like isoform X2 [Rhineura floridana]